jgi:cytochrome c oxidase subunit 2
MPLRLFSLVACLFLMAPAAVAGIPRDGALGFQAPATRIHERVHFFHDVLLVIITAITLFVLALLLWVMIRYNKRVNPNARKFSHNTLVEVVWITVPAIILVGIAGLSFPNLYYQEVTPNLERITERTQELRESGSAAQLEAYLRDHFPEAAALGFVNVKVQGNQWNWTYTYPDIADDTGEPIEFVSNPVHKGRATDPRDGRPRLLATDYPMVLPAGRYIRYYTAASDVIHSWTVPAFGIKTDAIPGRLNEGWFLVEQPGVYYGQCSELCGVDHAFMPIEVRVVPQAQFDRWAELMAAGDFDSAAASVQQIAALDTASQLAALE